MPAAPDCAPSLAAPERRRPPQRATPRTSRRGFFGDPSRRTLSRRYLPHRTAPGYRARCYKTVSGRPKWLNADPAGLAGGLNLYGYVGNNPVGSIDPLGLRDVDVYIWSAAITGWHSISVGHVMVTEHDSTKVILSQFPANGLMQGRNITLPYKETCDDEKRPADYHFVVHVSDDKAFDNSAAWERAKMTWGWDPSDNQQTQCSTAAWNALVDGGLNLGGNVSGTLLPGTMADIFNNFAPFSHGNITPK